MFISDGERSSIEGLIVWGFYLLFEIFLLIDLIATNARAHTHTHTHTYCVVPVLFPSYLLFTLLFSIANLIVFHPCPLGTSHSSTGLQESSSSRAFPPPDPGAPPLPRGRQNGWELEDNGLSFLLSGREG